MSRAPVDEGGRTWQDMEGSRPAETGPHPAPRSPRRLRRVDAFSACLWALLLALHLAEQYLQADSPSWLDTLKFSTMSLCCLVGFTAAVATKKATGSRRFRPRRSEKQQ